jgi:hypothetical protein
MKYNKKIKNKLKISHVKKIRIVRIQLVVAHLADVSLAMFVI